MNYYYTDEKNAQIVIALLKKHGIRKIVASPGTTNICLVSSIQRDSFFEVYSAPEERSGAYIACGLSAECGEPVVITCTGATASRNYFPALTEAYYRKLPILAITCSRRGTRIGHNIDQVTDRTQLPKDIAKMTVQVPLVYDQESEWGDVIAVNKAILELSHHGNGPVHINLETNYSTNYSVQQLPDIRAIYRLNESEKNKFPEIKGKKIAVMIGSHLPWNDKLEQFVELFCSTYDAIVLGDHTSNYHGKYGIRSCLLGQQRYYNSFLYEELDLVIHLGDVFAPGFEINAKEVWRVNNDGNLVDTFRKLTYVFEMEEEVFFERYCEKTNGRQSNNFINKCKQEEKIAKNALNNIVNSLPFSNAWVASQIIAKLPQNSVIHFGIQNSLRFWNYFDLQESVYGYSNVGGFGIDGCMSTLIGAALYNPQKIYYCVLGDLAFFYDLNSLGNRHVGKNVRIIVVNNGKGTEFKLTGNPGHLFGDETDKYIAAAGHYGNKSNKLVKDYVENLGFSYYAANNKKELLSILNNIINPEIGEKPLVLEVFTDSLDEDNALTMIRECLVDNTLYKRKKAVKAMKSVLGEKRVEAIKKIVK